MTAEHSARAALAGGASAAGSAPSVHNTQPWRWRVHADRLDLYVDRSRQLDVADPDRRLLMISCGTALHHARTALAAEGWAAAVTRFPAPVDPDHLAEVRLGDRIEVTPEAMRRFQATQIRHTDRRPVSGTGVPSQAITQVRDAVEAEAAHLHVLRPEQVSELAAAAADAEEQVAADPARHAEMAFWVGGPQPGTGMPETVIPSAPPRTEVPTRDFGHPGTLPAGPGDDRAATYSVIFGDEDAPASWLCAGEALSAAWLTATEHGVAVVPFSAVVEAPATRALLRRLLAGLGHPFLVLRLGMADPDHPGPPHTPRLEPAQIVEYVGDS